jgi:predicted Zn-dependent protease
VNYQLAQVLRGLGQHAEADAALRTFTELRAARWAAEAATRAADREPKNAALQYEVGRCYVALGEPEVAVSWFVQALKIDANHKASHAALADYYARQSDPGAAERAQFHRERAK